MNDGQEKTEEATPKRRRDARMKGTVAKSSDLTGALVLVALSLVLPGALSAMGSRLFVSFQNGLGNIPHDVSLGSIWSYSWLFLQPCLVAFVVISATAMIVGLTANFAQVGFVISAESMNPTLDKINPFAGLKRLFSLRVVIEGLKTIVKTTLFGWIAYQTIVNHWNELLGLSWVNPYGSLSVVGGLIASILVRVAIAWLVISALDYFFQRKQVEKQLRMSKEELKREMKEQETSPEMKTAMHRRRAQLAKGRPLTRVPKADVVITNPTHYAVAIQYDRSKMMAPMVVAKGADLLALKIREIAKAHRVPIIENKPLARALYKQCEAGDFVPRELFQAVAEVLAYVYQTIKGMR